MTLKKEIKDGLLIVLFGLVATLVGGLVLGLFYALVGLVAVLVGLVIMLIEIWRRKNEKTRK